MSHTASPTQQQQQQQSLHRSSDVSNNTPILSPQQEQQPSAVSSRCESPLRPMAGLLDWLPIAGHQTPTHEHSSGNISGDDSGDDKNRSPKKDKKRKNKKKTRQFSPSSSSRRLSSPLPRGRADANHHRQLSSSSLVLSNDDQQREQELNNSNSTTHFMGSVSNSSKRAARSVFRSVVFDEGGAESAPARTSPPLPATRADTDSCEAQHHSLSSLIDIVKRSSVSSSPILSQSSVMMQQRSIDGLGMNMSKRSSSAALCSTQAVMSVSGDSNQRWGFSASTIATLGKGEDGYLSRERTPRTLSDQPHPQQQQQGATPKPRAASKSSTTVIHGSRQPSSEEPSSSVSCSASPRSFEKTTANTNTSTATTLDALELLDGIQLEVCEGRALLQLLLQRSEEEPKIQCNGAAGREELWSSFDSSLTTTFTPPRRASHHQLVPHPALSCRSSSSSTPPLMKGAAVPVTLSFPNDESILLKPLGGVVGGGSIGMDNALPSAKVSRSESPSPLPRSHQHPHYGGAPLRFVPLEDVIAVRRLYPVSDEHPTTTTGSTSNNSSKSCNNSSASISPTPSHHHTRRVGERKLSASAQTHPTFSNAQLLQRFELLSSNSHHRYMPDNVKEIARDDSGGGANRAKPACLLELALRHPHEVKESSMSISLSELSELSAPHNVSTMSPSNLQTHNSLFNLLASTSTLPQMAPNAGAGGNVVHRRTAENSQHKRTQDTTFDRAYELIASSDSTCATFVFGCPTLDVAEAMFRFFSDSIANSALTCLAAPRLPQCAPDTIY